jgi:hypothetical protein
MERFRAMEVSSARSVLRLRRPVTARRRERVSDSAQRCARVCGASQSTGIDCRLGCRLCASVQRRSEVRMVAPADGGFPAGSSNDSRGAPLALAWVEVTGMRASMLCLGGVLLLSVLPVNGGEPLQMAVSPAQSFAPSNLRVRVRLEPNAENRRLAVIADSPDFYRRSEMQLEGDQAPKTITIEFRGVPGGSYQVSSVVLDQSGRPRASASRGVNVIFPFGQ